MAKEDFDLFAFLSKLGSRDINAYNNLSEDAKKQASPLVIMRWMTGTSDQAQVIRINEFVNPYVFSLGSHKELLFKLLATASTGSSRRYSWAKGPTSIQAKSTIEVLRQYYNCSSREAKLHLRSVKKDDLLLMGDSLGWTKDEMKKLKDELEPKKAKK